jgi:hypothetical protein
MAMAERAEIVKSGTWLYDHHVPHGVWIVRQNFDFHWDEGFEDKPERLNPDGEVFQVLITDEARIRTVVFPACLTLEEAVALAEKTIQLRITWDDHRIQKLYAGRRYELSNRAAAG